MQRAGQPILRLGRCTDVWAWWKANWGRVAGTTAGVMLVLSGLFAAFALLVITFRWAASVW